MNKKILLLALIMLVTVPIMAQTPFEWAPIELDEESNTTMPTAASNTTPTTTTTPADTTTVTTVVKPVQDTTIPVYRRTWQTLEEQVKIAARNGTNTAQIEKKKKAKEKVILVFREKHIKTRY